jgi:hypothetical protein
MEGEKETLLFARLWFPSLDLRIKWPNMTKYLKQNSQDKPWRTALRLFDEWTLRTLWNCDALFVGFGKDGVYSLGQTYAQRRATQNPPVTSLRLFLTRLCTPQVFDRDSQRKKCLSVMCVSAPTDVA